MIVCSLSTFSQPSCAAATLLVVAAGEEWDAVDKKISRQRAHQEIGFCLHVLVLTDPFSFLISFLIFSILDQILPLRNVEAANAYVVSRNASKKRP